MLYLHNIGDIYAYTSMYMSPLSTFQNEKNHELYT